MAKGWSPEAREASVAVRRAKAKGTVPVPKAAPIGAKMVALRAKDPFFKKTARGTYHPRLNAKTAVRQASPVTNGMVRGKKVKGSTVRRSYRPGW